MNPYRTSIVLGRAKPASFWRRIGGWWRGTYKKMVARKAKRRRRLYNTGNDVMDGFIEMLMKEHNMCPEDVAITRHGDAVEIRRIPTKTP